MNVFPDTIQLGDVTKVDVSKLDKIDLLIGGSRGSGNLRRERAEEPKEGYGLYVISEKQSASTIDTYRDVCATWKNTGGVEAMIKRFCKWMTSPEDLPGLVMRMLTAILLTVVWAFLLALIATLTMRRL